VVMAIALTAAVTGGTARAATRTAPGGGPATTAVMHTVGKGAQAAARTFWTKARMAAALPPGAAPADLTPGRLGSDHGRNQGSPA
jgi:hypothetical protein